jgi:hypothetical protein
MNPRRVAIATATAILLASMFPPFQIAIGNRIVGLGYSFLLSPPYFGNASQLTGSIDIGTLFVEYVGILAVGALAWLLGTSIPLTSTGGETTQDQPAKKNWGRMKKVAATGLSIMVVIVVMALSKGIVRSLLHKPTNAHLAKPTNAVPTLDKFLEVARQDNPGVSDEALTSYWQKTYGNTAQRVPERPTPSDDDVRKAAAAAQVEKAHPGWKRTVATPQFSAWLAKQSEQVKKLAESEEPADAIRLLDKFATDTNYGKRGSSGTPPNNSEEALNKFLQGGSDTEMAARFKLTLQEYKRRDARSQLLCVSSGFHDFNCMAEVLNGQR